MNHWTEMAVTTSQILLIPPTNKSPKYLQSTILQENSTVQPLLKPTMRKVSEKNNQTTMSIKPPTSPNKKPLKSTTILSKDQSCNSTINKVNCLLELVHRGIWITITKTLWSFSRENWRNSKLNKEDSNKRTKNKLKGKENKLRAKLSREGKKE